jgi:hypothetical protein
MTIDIQVSDHSYSARVHRTAEDFALGELF